MTLADGTPLSPALGIGAFSNLTVVDSVQAVKVNPAARPEAAGLIGCGIMAGLGAALNTGNVGRGDSVAVIGCGGVGNAAIAGSRLSGAHTIIAVDLDDRKLEWAKDFGYDTDSRKAETTYRACLEIALQLRNGIGEAGFTRLQEASFDY